MELRSSCRWQAISESCVSLFVHMHILCNILYILCAYNVILFHCTQFASRSNAMLCSTHALSSLYSTGYSLTWPLGPVVELWHLY